VPAFRRRWVDGRILLTPKGFQVSAILMTRPAAGQPELLDVVSPETFMEVRAMNAQAFDLRQTLEDQSSG
jgi:hypothetical protein